MPVKKNPLKSGKELTVPSLFINPQSAIGGEAIREILTRYGKGEGHDGINQIDGIHIFFKDWNRVTKQLSQAPLSEEEKNEYQKKLGAKLLLVDPGVHYLFTGSSQERDDTFRTNAYPPKVSSLLERIKKTRQRRIERYIKYVYPLFDDDVLKNILKFQLAHRIQSGAPDIIVLPSFPITSLEKISEQIKELNNINKKGIDIFNKNDLFKEFRGKRDVMSILTIKPSILTKKSFFEELIEAMRAKEVDHLGIRLLDLDGENENQITSVLNFIEMLHDTTKSLTKKEKTIHILNVREFGYVCYGYWSGVANVPIASEPYFRRSPGKKFVPLGSYYHPIDLINDSIERLFEKTRNKSYRFPCHCEICDEYERITKVDDSIWNKFRKMHFLLAKNMEIKEFRESETQLKVAVYQKFVRAKQTHWLPYLEDAPSTF